MPEMTVFFSFLAILVNMSLLEYIASYSCKNTKLQYYICDMVLSKSRFVNVGLNGIEGDDDGYETEEDIDGREDDIEL